MVLTKKEAQKNKLRDLLDYHYNSDYNVIKFSRTETNEHILAKCITCIELIKTGSDIITEARLKDGFRPDILEVNVNGIMAIEILATENEREYEKNKLKKYPIPTICLIAEEVIEKFNKKLEKENLIRVNLD